MNRRIFNVEQIENLLDNRYVAKCTEKSITYSREFKMLAIKRHYEGQNAAQIFRDAGFELAVVGRNLPYACMNRWLRTCRLEGLARLNKETRGHGGSGGRPRSKDLTAADRIKRLETEIAYLKAENYFLVKLRALKKS